MTDWQRIYADVEDRVVPHFQLDIWERGLYFYLLRHTRLSGLESATIPLLAISSALRCSEWQARKIIRVLSAKGCIELEPTRRGHHVKVLLPSELSLPDSVEEKPNLDIEQVDFFKNREFVGSLLAREQKRCFYCLSDVSGDTCELDHVIPQVNGGGNSYRNIVASCHQCNTKKQGNGAEDFIRQLYRRSLLSEKEFEGRLQALAALSDGHLKPEL